MSDDSRGYDAPAPTDTVKIRLTGERAPVKAMIDALDPVLDIVQDWRIFPQRNEARISAYLEARPHREEGECHA
ncbi:hypothetical protein H0264_14495 [Nocardia huaxiensis]|uniref:Uncharacterized protein n=1 Tax=Nocardia huaxiensis TaxID=2755382 RepID=A0A7D6VHW7_9NOCA|nr:hypothetical protein [Nocardia huaxiensis]QLY33277.1 hypothetical protein H0264_14495 [Nocardia huaxiensis]